jgi:hypothetical protein
MYVVATLAPVVLITPIKAWSTWPISGLSIRLNLLKTFWKQLKFHWVIFAKWKWVLCYFLWTLFLTVYVAGSTTFWRQWNHSSCAAGKFTKSLYFRWFNFFRFLVTVYLALPNSHFRFEKAAPWKSIACTWISCQPWQVYNNRNVIFISYYGYL